MLPIAILTIESEDDRQYMTCLYHRHRALMLKTAWTFTREKADVEDIISESCVALINNIDVLHTLEEHHLRRYITITVRNKALDLLRRRQRENVSFVSLDAAASCIPAPEDTEKKVLLFDELRQVQRLLQSLPEKERDVLRLKYQQGMKHKEISKALGIAESTVTTYVKRAREYLRSAMY